MEKTVVLAFLAAAAAFGETQVSLTAEGWTVTADPQQGVLTIAHEKLGPVLERVRLGPGPWTAAADGQEFTLRTDQPPGSWRFELRENLLVVSTTARSAVLTASLPAPKTRLPARLLDPQGPPVEWTGTNEVGNSYGGSMTRNPSFLPRHNADTMYFTLGQASAGSLHSLFDRPTDTAIDLPEDSRLERDRENPDRLALRLPVQGRAVVRLIPDYFTKTLHVPYYVPMDDSYFDRAPMVWSSWTSYYDEVREEDIVRNADWLAANLKPYGFQYVQLDDGYDRGERGQHYWIESWNKETFPHGPAWLANYIRSKGLKAGLWVVPNAYAGAAESHPAWYLRDKAGNFIKDYNTPALDSSNPEVLGFLRHMFETLDGWGFDYYKFDGEHALPKYVPAVDRDKLYDNSTDALVVYRQRLNTIRETLGPRRFIEGCPAGTPLNGIGYMNSYFNGQDLYNNWQGMSPLFSSISANGFLNHLAVYVMPGEGLELGLPMSVEEAAKKRPPRVLAVERQRELPLTGFGLTDEEARTLVTHVALTGVAYPLASVMPELPPERVKLLQATLPTMPILPADLFSRGTGDVGWDTFRRTPIDYFIHDYPEILDVKVNAASGMYDVAGVTNWSGRPVKRSLDLADKLGLTAGQSSVAFDFWNRKVLGVLKDRIELEIGPHDTRVLLIHPLEGRPQLVGISRHISGAYSIRALAWEGNTLRGSAESVPGDPYSLYIYVPGGAKVSRVHATAGGREVPVRQERAGHSLTVSFDGQASPVDWEVVF